VILLIIGELQAAATITIDAHTASLLTRQYSTYHEISLSKIMKKITSTVRQFVLCVLLLTAVANIAHAETINCTPVNSVPAVISSQGVYCLNGNLATNSANGWTINITANNVTLDLNGWKVGGQAAGAATEAVGIYSSANNITIKNGIVRGFWWGILLTGRGAVVEDMLVDQNTTVGIEVDGQGSIVRRNHIVDTGGSTVQNPSPAFGIVTFNTGIIVENNVISGLTATGATAGEWGIHLVGDYDTARHNIVTDDAKPASNYSFGVNSSGSEDSIVDNVITNFIYGVIYDSTGVYSRNTVSGCDTPFYGGTAGSGNDHD
jgi:hypothetical protein